MVQTKSIVRKIKKMSKDSSGRGLTDNELNKAEEIYDIKFPHELRKVLKASPRDSGIFYDWGDFSKENVNNIKKVISYEKEYFSKYFSEIYWPDSYVAMGLDKNKEEFKKKLDAAPKLIPLFSYRCMASGIDNGPVFSLVGTDIIYYGRNLKEGFNEEFFPNRFLGKVFRFEYDRQVKVKVPFWSDMVEL